MNSLTIGPFQKNLQTRLLQNLLLKPVKNVLGKKQTNNVFDFSGTQYRDKDTTISFKKILIASGYFGLTGELVVILPPRLLCRFETLKYINCGEQGGWFYNGVHFLLDPYLVGNDGGVFNTFLVLRQYGESDKIVKVVTREF